MSAIFIYFILGQRRANFEFQIGWMTKCIITFLHIDHIHIFLRKQKFFPRHFQSPKNGREVSGGGGGILLFYKLNQCH